MAITPEHYSPWSASTTVTEGGAGDIPPLSLPLAEHDGYTLGMEPVELHAEPAAAAASAAEPTAAAAIAEVMTPLQQSPTLVPDGGPDPMMQVLNGPISTGPTVPAAASALASASASAPGGPTVPAVVDPAANLPTPPPLPEVEHRRYTYERLPYEDCPETLLDSPE